MVLFMRNVQYINYFQALKEMLACRYKAIYKTAFITILGSCVSQLDA